MPTQFKLDYAPPVAAEATLDSRAVAICTGLSRLAGIVTAVVGLLGLIGWYQDIETFKALFFGAITMKANAAVCLLTAGLALLILSGEKRPAPRYHLAGYFLGLAVCVVGGMTLSEHITGRNLGIDELLITEPAGA